MLFIPVTMIPKIRLPAMIRVIISSLGLSVKKVMNIIVVNGNIVAISSTQTQLSRIMAN